MNIRRIKIFPIPYTYTYDYIRKNSNIYNIDLKKIYIMKIVMDQS